MKQITDSSYIETSINAQRRALGKSIIVLCSLLVWFGLFNFTEFTFQESLALSITFYSLIEYIHTLGKYINIPESTVAIFNFQLLLMPVVAYNYRPSDMNINETDYFNFVLPAMLAMTAGYKVMNISNNEHANLIVKAKQHLATNSSITYKLFYIGLAAYFIELVSPIYLKQIFSLFSNCLYISVLYNRFSGKNSQKYIPIIVLALMLAQTVRTGMFGHIFVWMIVWIPFLLINTKLGRSATTKFLFVAASIAFLPILQSVKYQYRIITWNKDRLEKEKDSSTLLNLFSNSLGNYSDNLVDNELLYGNFNRLNQGGLLSQAMSYVPHYEPFANGEVLLHFFYPFIPRLIWSDKPITGGKQNMLRYAGIDNGDINSSNISPLGEAYVNFGPVVGVLFMLFYGILFGFVYNKMFQISLKKPTIILWIPTLFIASTLAETDILSIWGTCATGAVFLFLFNYLSKRLNIYL